jgi:hypothetical protein
VPHEALCLVHLVQNRPARLIGVNLATMTTMVMMTVTMGLELLAKTTVTMAMAEKMMAVKMVKVLPCYLHFVRHPWLTICLHRLYLLPLVQVH